MADRFTMQDPDISFRRRPFRNSRNRLRAS